MRREPVGVFRETPLQLDERARHRGLDSAPHSSEQVRRRFGHHQTRVPEDLWQESSERCSCKLLLNEF